MSSFIFVFWALAILTLCLSQCTLCAPAEGFLPWNGDCTHDESVLELCQRCAIESKSNVVYPMCCEAREEARTWCESFLSYGIRY